MVHPGRPLPRDAALVILPGSKATIADLEFLRREGWDIDLLAHRRQGGKILGICGGFQMLGRTITDPLGMEGPQKTVPGLGLLDIETVLCGTKLLIETAGIEQSTGTPVRGYEMHLGVTTGPELSRPMLSLTGGADGCISRDGRIAGCYLHGLFTSDPFRRAFLRSLGAEAGEIAYEQGIEDTLDALADHLEHSLDLSAMLAAARPARFKRAA
jgi:adenosylcobyric acid synthase